MESLPEEIVVFHIVGPDEFFLLITLSRHFRDMLLPYFPRLIKKWLPREVLHINDGGRFPPLLGDREFDYHPIGVHTVYSSIWTAGRHKGKLHGEFKIAQNDKVLFAVNYRFGVLHGKFMARIDSSYFGEVRKLTGQFINGKKEGISHQYYLGHLYYRLHFRAGQKMKVECFRERNQKAKPIPEEQNYPKRVIEYTYYRYYKVIHDVEYRKNGTVKKEITHNFPNT